MDVKKLGRIPDGGSWRADGGTPATHVSRIDKTPTGYDYVHPLVDDHSRFAYSEILPDEKARPARCSWCALPHTSPRTALATSSG